MPAMAPRAPTADSACEYVARRLWDYIDGRLSPSALAEFEAHLARCDGCPRFVSFARLVHGVLTTLDARTATDDTWDDETV
jgi:anti-sigma factor RsiW